jgi:hypothetical protein
MSPRIEIKKDRLWVEGYRDGDFEIEIATPNGDTLTYLDRAQQNDLALALSAHLLNTNAVDPAAPQPSESSTRGSESYISDVFAHPKERT